MNFYASFEINAENCLNNRAINYGDGLFETLLVSDGSIPLWRLHMRRLLNDLPRLGLEKIDTAVVYAKIIQLCQNKGDFIAKLVVFRSVTQRGYRGNTNNVEWYINIAPYESLLKEPKIGFSSIHLAHQKQLAGLKHLNRLEQVMAANALIGTNYTDAVVCDKKNNIIETISKNIVFIKNKQLYTPKLNNCGVYGVALRWLQSQGYHLQFQKIKKKQLASFDAMLVCNAVSGFMEVKNIANKFHFATNSPIIADIKTKWGQTLNTA